MITYDLIRLLLQWCNDAQSREMIEYRGYCYDYFSDYGEISGKELEALCKYINPILKLMGCTIRITWSMGEIIPIRNRTTIEQIIDKEMR